MNIIFYLYIIIAGYNTANPVVNRVAYPSEQACLTALAAAKHSQSGGADDENVLVLFCGGEDYQRYYNGTFWRGNKSE